MSENWLGKFSEDSNNPKRQPESPEHLHGISQYNTTTIKHSTLHGISFLEEFQTGLGDHFRIGLSSLCTSHLCCVAGNEVVPCWPGNNRMPQDHAQFQHPNQHVWQGNATKCWWLPSQHNDSKLFVGCSQGVGHIGHIDMQLYTIANIFRLYSYVDLNIVQRPPKLQTTLGCDSSAMRHGLGRCQLGDRWQHAECIACEPGIDGQLLVCLGGWMCTANQFQPEP